MAKIQKGTIVIAWPPRGNPSYCLGIVQRSTAGSNFQVRTTEGSFIYSADRLIPLARAVGDIECLTVKEVVELNLPQILKNFAATHKALAELSKPKT